MQLLIPDNRKSYAFDNLIITDVSNYVVVKLFDGERLIINEKYFKNKNNEVILKNLGEFLTEIHNATELRIGNGQEVGKAFEVEVFVYNEKNEIEVDTQSQPIIVYPCMSVVDDVKSIRLMCLTRTNKKITSTNHIEYLSAYEDEIIQIDVEFVDNNNNKQKETLYTSSPLGDGSRFLKTKIYQFDFSVKSIVYMLSRDKQKVAKEILSYSIKIATGDEDSRVVYEIVPEELSEVTTFIFRNSFFGTETVNIATPQIIENKWSRETALINNRAITIDSQLEKTFTASTGWITREESSVVEDMLNSKQVALILNNNIIPIVILSETFKISEAKNELINIEFSYKISSKNQMRNDCRSLITINKTKIFSNIFSNIFK